MKWVSLQHFIANLTSTGAFPKGTLATGFVRRIISTRTCWRPTYPVSKRFYETVHQEPLYRLKQELCTAVRCPHTNYCVQLCGCCSEIRLSYDRNWVCWLSSAADSLCDADWCMKHCQFSLALRKKKKIRKQNHLQRKKDIEYFAMDFTSARVGSHPSVPERALLECWDSSLSLTV